MFAPPLTANAFDFQTAPKSPLSVFYHVNSKRQYFPENVDTRLLNSLFTRYKLDSKVLLSSECRHEMY